MKYQKQTIIKKHFFVHSIKTSNPLKDLGTSSEELKEVSILLAKKGDIKGYKSMSEDELLSALTQSKPAKKGKKKVLLKQK